MKIFHISGESPKNGFGTTVWLSGGKKKFNFYCMLQWNYKSKERKYRWLSTGMQLWVGEELSKCETKEIDIDQFDYLCLKTAL